MSSVELYRLGELEELPYDLSDPLDRAIWTGLQVYVDYLETVDLEERSFGEREANVYASDVARATVSQREPARFEKYMRDLADSERGKKPMSEENRYLTALRILEALFASAKQLTGRPMRWRQGEYNVKRDVWEEGDRYLEDLLDEWREAGIEADGGAAWPPIPTRVAHEPAYFLPERIGPLFALVVKSLGGLVSQSEAARRLGLTPRGVSLRIQRGELKEVRVGQKVFVREEDVEAAETRGERARSED